MDVPATAALQLGDSEIVLSVRRSLRARRIMVRIHPVTFGVELVLPRRASLADGLRFAARQSHWIERRLKRLPQRVTLAQGALVPIEGVPHRLRHVAQARRSVERLLMEDGSAELIVGGGEAAHLARRVKDFLRGEARRIIAPLAHAKAAQIGKRIRRFSLRDSRTRWGSCSSAGSLSFSWRLVMAPPNVIDYLAAHEVAHLLEPNHGPRFWQRCAELAGHDISASRAWLRQHGEAILAIG